jgi:FMN phosphatase YigB (HAD superfamily)
MCARYDSQVTLKAAFFDVGDTLVEHWAPRGRLNELAREVLRREFGEREWYDAFLDASFGPDAMSLAQRPGERLEAAEGRLRQETLRWYEEWFRNSSIGIDDIDIDRLRAAVVLPLDLVSKPVPGAFTAVRWCRSKGLRTVLVTNTLARGDEDVWEDWRRFGLADALDGVVSSHSVGWQKPHRKIYERALEIAGAAPHEAFMVGDRLDADIWGAKRVGLRAVWRRTEHAQPEIDTAPDATISDLTELPHVIEAWLEAPSRVG